MACSESRWSRRGCAGRARARGLVALGVALALFGLGCADVAGREAADEDGDTVRDTDEGRSESRGVDGVVAIRDRDTDRDGIPDYLDLDSDGDGLPDALEAGDVDGATPPRDADGDGQPDLRDLDSDDNGIPDAREGTADTDGDGVLDHADLDDDDDLVRDDLELDGVLDPPRDFDGDGEPDFRDVDSDDDLIFDGDEHGADTDRDGDPDVRALDSDGDGIPDREEAGDDDVFSPPRDTDGDAAADFRDADSDDDGLSDADELGRGTSPVAVDTDGDGVTDLVELVADTDPLDASVSPRTRGDFVFVVPFEEPPAPTRDTLTLRTSIQLADVYFLFDGSGSMTAERDALVGAVGALIDGLTCAGSEAPCTHDVDCAEGEVCSALRGVCLEDPAASACVASPHTGVGTYGEHLENRLSVQADPRATAAALASLTTGGGTERLYVAIDDLVRGLAGSGEAMGCAPDAPGRLGCAGFRADAVKVVVVFTDEDSDGGALVGAGAALREAEVTLLGVWAGAPSDPARAVLVDLAREGGSLDGAGRPLVLDGVDAAVVPAVSSAIQTLVEGVPLRVTLAMADEPDDAGDALAFVDHVEVAAGRGRCPAITPLEDSDDDGRMDTFPALRPGTPVCWDVVPRANISVPETSTPQVFRARLTVLGDGSPLDERVIFFLVPPRIDPPGGPF